jgi:tRNA-specific 2-thiouridylase
MKERVVVAMSGGVDSSVAAALLKESGLEVIGITMCFSAVGGSAFGGNLPDVAGRKPRCCGTQGIEDARRVAHKLGIKHYVLNMQKSLEEKIIKDFCREYAGGRTPNPCVRCNQFLKFGILLNKALSLGAQYLATGHYARIVRKPKTENRTAKYFLEKAKDRKKDQSYFLCRLNQRQLKHALFPLGNYTKSQVRRLARKFALPVADKLASQEICFLPDDDYRIFLKKRLNAENIKPGLITDKQGNVLGEHKGLAFYTIGQRQGLGIAMGYPVYITKIDSGRNRIILGKREKVLSRRFLVKNPHFIAKPFKKKVVLGVRIRYNHKEAQAEVMPFDKKIKVNFKKPQFAVTPGQSAVFYDGDTVIGGGIIERIID